MKPDLEVFEKLFSANDQGDKQMQQAGNGADDQDPTQREIPVPPSETEIRRIVSYFDDPQHALELLQDHLRGGTVADGRGEEMPFTDFLSLHRSAYERRKKAGTPHFVHILERELNGFSRSGGVYPQRRRARTLEEIERRRDRLGQNREMFGRYDSDVNPLE